MKICFRKEAFGLLLTCTFLCNACQPAKPVTKEEYLLHFKFFAREVSSHCSKISKKEFASLDRQYLRFSRDWYEKFYNELSIQEKWLIWKYRSQYIACKVSHQLHKVGKEFYYEMEDQMLPQSHLIQQSSESSINLFISSLNVSRK